MIEGPDVSEISVESNATYTMNCIDSFGVASSATSCTAGTGGEPGYSGGNTGGQGAAIRWNGQTTFTRNIKSGIVWDGSAGFIKIYRGNTNTIN